MNVDETLNKFVKECQNNGVTRILDIGAGKNTPHTNIMRQLGLNVETNDIRPSDHRGLYHELTDLGKFDGIWASHVLEHQRNVGDFLDKIYNDLEDGGVLAITIPPRKDDIVGGHVTLWNAGLLLYNLILAGFDCQDASVATYGYNISVIVKKSPIVNMPELCYDSGDILALKKYFPKDLDIYEGFNGIILAHNWYPAPSEPPLFGRKIEK